MKITGVGPKIGIQTMLYFLITILVHYLTIPVFIISDRYYPVIMIIGFILIMSGTVFLFILARNLQKSFNNEILMTDGAYRYFRNPMYAMYIIFIIPGISLVLNSWLSLTTVVVFYILFSIYIREEYEYLDTKFGEEYRNYLNKVWVKFL